jgi:hypothetical protein
MEGGGAVALGLQRDEVFLDGWSRQSLCAGALADLGGRGEVLMGGLWLAAGVGCGGGAFVTFGEAAGSGYDPGSVDQLVECGACVVEVACR